MTKSELIDRVAEARNLPRKTAEEIVNLLFDSMREALCDGERIELRGFGTFQTRFYPGYIGRNPKTSAAIQVHPKVLPVFRVGKSLYERVNSAG